MKILVPVDNSKMSDVVVENAMEIGEKFEAKLILIRILDDLNIKDSYSYPSVYNELIKGAEEELEDFKGKFSNYPYELESIFKVGMPYREIMKAADDEDVDLIIMGNRGRGLFSRTLLGSVSNKVLNNSKKSVLIVKSDLEDDEKEQ